MTFNPVTSTKTKLVERFPMAGVRIYEHRAKGVAGKYIVSDDTGKNWSACETLEGARHTRPGEPVRPEFERATIST